MILTVEPGREREVGLWQGGTHLLPCLIERINYDNE